MVFDEEVQQYALVLERLDVVSSTVYGSWFW